MGILLYFVAVFINVLLAIAGLFHTIFGAIRYGGKFRYINAVFMKGARALDIYGNVAYASMLNDLFLKRGGHHYGDENETVSSATGKNWVTGNLTFLGKGLAGTLNMIDNDHCWKYIEGDKDLYHLIGHPGKVPFYYTYSFIFIAGLGLYLLFRLNYWLLF